MVWTLLRTTSVQTSRSSRTAFVLTACFAEIKSEEDKHNTDDDEEESGEIESIDMLLQWSTMVGIEVEAEE